MRTKQYVNTVKSLPKDQQENHKKALVHLIAFHTGNKPDAVESSLKNKDGFINKKIDALHPSIMSEIYKSSLTHGNLKGKK